MPRRRSAPTGSALSENTEVDIDGIAETEMVKLQRQFRIMEGERQTYSAPSQETIRKQGQEIERLQRENAELQINLAVIDTPSARQQASEGGRRLRALLEQRDALDRELEDIKRSQKDLEMETSQVQSEMEQLRKEEVSAFSSKQSEAQRAEKLVCTLENRLDRAQVRFNEQVTQNAQLREELETLRVERAKFQELHQRLDKELKSIRMEIGEMISLSTAAYEAKVEAQAKASVLREKAERDLAQFNSEVKELERIIAHERRLNQFMAARANQRGGGSDEAPETSRNQEQKKLDAGRELEEMEEAIHRIQDVTGEDTLDRLAATFVQAEDRNFALYNFVHEQNNEAAALRDQISQIKAEMQRFSEDVLRQNDGHAALRTELERRRAETEAQCDQHQAQASSTNALLEQLKTGVSSMFLELECDPSLIEDGLGSSAGIRDNNIMAYLGQVEKKTNTLLSLKDFLHSKEMEEDYSASELLTSLLGHQPAILQAQTAAAQPPSGQIEESLIEDEDQPLSREDLLQRMVKGASEESGVIPDSEKQDP